MGSSCATLANCCEYNPAFFSGAITLLAAGGFFRDRHLQQANGKQGLEDLVPELGAVSSGSNGHEIRNRSICQALAQDFNLVPTWSRLSPSTHFCRWNRRSTGY